MDCALCSSTKASNIAGWVTGPQFGMGPGEGWIRSKHATCVDCHVDVAKVTKPWKAENARQAARAYDSEVERRKASKH